MMKEILDFGVVKNDRTNTGTKSIFGTQLRFDLSNNKFPLLTTKKMFLKGIVEELLFFLRGDTQTKKLEEKNVMIWKGNTSKEFQQSRGLFYLPEGDMGKGYGYLWRNFYGVDQIEKVFEDIKHHPESRRLVVSAWSPAELDQAVLPPCHNFFQFYVANGKLSCMFNMRSVDTFLGLPFNIASYALLTHSFAKATNLEAKELIFTGGDTHCYLNHIEQIKIQHERNPFEFPSLNISKKIESINDICGLSLEDISIANYQSHPSIKALMAI